MTGLSKWSLGLLWYLPLFAWAADEIDVPVTNNRPAADSFFSDSNLPVQMQNRVPKIEMGLPEVPLDQENGEDQELQLSKALNQALYTQNWEELERLLEAYSKLPNFDAVQYVYVWGLLYRHQGDLPKAIALYQQLLEKRSQLAYVRLHYAIFLFENQQLNDAEEQFKQVVSDPNVASGAKELAEKYLAAIERNLSWQFDYGANYTQNNNVNNAPDSEYSPSIYDNKIIILPNGQIIYPQRAPNPKPIVAHGIHYYLSADKNINLTGSHYLQISSAFNGTTYWDAHDYDEKQLYLSLGHQYRTARYSVGANILGMQNWLGSSRYNNLYGVGVSTSYLITPQQLLRFNFGHLRRSYHDESDKGYNGIINQVSTTYLYNTQSPLLWFVGADFSHEHTITEHNRSSRAGISGGMVYNTPQSFGMQLNGRYGLRQFNGRPFYIQTSVNDRMDHEISANAAIWHKKLQWKGFIPKLNFQWSYIRSNIPEWYSRKNYGAYVSVERNF